jgi:hypothetical protein
LLPVAITAIATAAGRITFHHIFACPLATTLASPAALVVTT